MQRIRFATPLRATRSAPCPARAASPRKRRAVALSAVCGGPRSRPTPGRKRAVPRPGNLQTKARIRLTAALGADPSYNTRLALAAGRQPRGAARKMKDTTNRKPRALVADDEKTIANTLKLILEKSGYETRAVYSGEAAVEQLRDFQPDILVADVIMPGMTGIEAALQVRAALPSCKVLLISGHMATADLLEAARRQNHEFEILAKPVQPAFLLAKMSAAMIN